MKKVIGYLFLFAALITILFFFLWFISFFIKVVLVGFLLVCGLYLIVTSRRKTKNYFKRKNK